MLTITASRQQLRVGMAPTSRPAAALPRLAAAALPNTIRAQISQAKRAWRLAAAAPAAEEAPAAAEPVAAEPAAAAAAAAADAGADATEGKPKRMGRRAWRRSKAKNAPLTKGWWAEAEFTVPSLSAEILKRCETETPDEPALAHLCKLAATPEEARIALNAFAAVRSARVRSGEPKAFGPKVGAQFVEMIITCDAPDVLAEALKRSTELGLQLGSGRVHRALKIWGARGELPKVEEVLANMPLGGVEYDTNTAYVVVRTCVQLDQLEKADYYLAAMRDRQVRISPTTERILEDGKQRAAAAAQQESGVN